MPVNVMHVGRVWMRVLDPAVLVPMGMRLSRWVIRRVIMLMVLVMPVRMRVHHGLVGMLVLMMFGGMQPDTQSHKSTG